MPYTTEGLTMAKLLRQLSTTSKDNLSPFSIHHTVKGELCIACPSSTVVPWIRKLLKEGILALDVVCRAGQNKMLVFIRKVEGSTMTC